MNGLARIAVTLGLLSMAGLAFAQSLYKYRGADGEWVFTDRNPGEQLDIEVRELSRGDADPQVRVFYQRDGDRIRLFAQNDYHAPVQVVLGLDELRGVEMPDPEQSMRFTAAARDETYLMSFRALPDAARPLVAYRFLYLLGDPDAEHLPEEPYRAPFAVAVSHPISQAYPYSMTHTTRDSAYAVDIAMPIGSDVYAARGGTVFDVASTHFRGGIESEQLAAEANLVRILHDDGTYAIYAHLNWNSIRVRPGDVVERGEYIADSGNTGFSSGPHLHFAVIKNSDMRSESLPVEFEGADGLGVVPEIGNTLTAY